MNNPLSVLNISPANVFVKFYTKKFFDKKLPEQPRVFRIQKSTEQNPCFFELVELKRIELST